MLTLHLNLRPQQKRLLIITRYIPLEVIRFSGLIQPLLYATNVPVLTITQATVNLLVVNLIEREVTWINYMKNFNPRSTGQNRNFLEIRMQQQGTSINPPELAHKAITTKPLINLGGIMHKETRVILQLFRMVQPKEVHNTTPTNLNHLLSQFSQVNQ